MGETKLKIVAGKVQPEPIKIPNWWEVDDLTTDSSGSKIHDVSAGLRRHFPELYAYHRACQRARRVSFVLGVGIVILFTTLMIGVAP